MLEIDDVHSYYGDAHVLQGASLRVAEGEAVALLGRNGMGKTTLIRSIMRLAQPTVRRGAIRWRGEDLLGLRPHQVAQRRIALVPQGRRLFGSLTVLEHLTIVKSERDDTGWSVPRIFELFPRLAERRGHRGSQLSGGERQMLAIGRALITDPNLILMYEPSEGLAPLMVQHLEGIILRLKQSGLTILLVEQNFYSAIGVADRVYVMETGRIVHEVEAAAVRDDEQSLLQYLGVH
jgi:branched-chain amino acid transport system ATP-binding protein